MGRCHQSKGTSMTPQQLKAMKMALEALELLTDTEQTFDALDYGDNAITALEEVLAEHAMREVQRLGQEIEQEPVAWTLLLIGEHHGLVGKAGDKFVGHPEHYERVDVYPTPPKRTWVNLTDEDRNDCLVEADPCECLATPEAQELMRCVEAKSRSKNT